jgi:predicted solute-binding protein
MGTENTLDKSLSEFSKFLNSEEGKKHLEEYVNKQNRIDNIVKSQLTRLKNSNRFTELIEKAVEKYDSESYIRRWYRRSIEPPEDLFSFLFSYAQRYGRDCTDEECEKYSNMFTESLYYCEGYYFNLMIGQGSAIKIIKENGL